MNHSSPNGNSPLMFAVNLNKCDVIKHLIEQGAALNHWNTQCDGATALHLAVLLGNCICCTDQLIARLSQVL